jgi:hypothetical protein
MTKSSPWVYNVPITKRWDMKKAAIFLLSFFFLSVNTYADCGKCKSSFADVKPDPGSHKRTWTEEELENYPDLRLKYKHKFPKPQYGVDASKWEERKTEEGPTSSNIFDVEVPPKKTESKPTKPKKKKFNIREWAREWRAEIEARRQRKETERIMKKHRAIRDYGSEPKVRLSPEAMAQIEADIDKFLEEEFMRKSMKEFDKDNNPWDKPVPYLDTSKSIQVNKTVKTAPTKTTKGTGEVDICVDELHKANEAQAVVDKLKKKGYIDSSGTNHTDPKP